MSSIADLLDSDGMFGRDNAFSNMGGFVQGTVSDNGNKDFSGMVKVEFTAWKSGKNICEWIPLLRGYAGGAYGCYAVPEVGDLVLVGFIGVGMKRPFVLGSLFPADAKLPSESFVDKNTTKRFKTKGGIDLLLSDEKDKQSVSLSTPKGMKITLLDEKGTVTIADQKGENALTVDSQNGAITLTGKQKVVLKVGRCEISIDGQGGAVRIKSDKIELSANQQVSISGNQQVSLSGGMFKAEGKQTAQISGGAMTQIEGGLVKIN